MADKTYDYQYAMLVPEHAKAFPTKGGSYYPRQGSLILRAATKKAAAERLREFGYGWAKPSDLRVGMGNAVVALEEAGVLNDGDLFINVDYGTIVRVSMDDGKTVSKFFGTIRTKPVFVPAEGE